MTKGVGRMAVLTIQDQVRQLKYIHRFGQAQGVEVMQKLSNNQGLIEVSIPWSSNPVYIRSDTSDTAIFEQMFIEQEYYFNAPDFSPKFIIDGGANVGYSTVFFAIRYPEACIVAVEPEKSNYDMLVRNTNSYKNVIPVHAAIWHENTFLNIENPADQHVAFRVNNSDASSQGSIQAMTIFDLLELADKKDIDLLKLDIEGAEKELFGANNCEWLESTDILIMELHDWFRSGCGNAFYNAISPYRFNQINKGENIFVRLGESGFLSNPGDN